MRFRQMMLFAVSLLFLAGALWLWRAHQQWKTQNAYHLTYTAPRPGLPGNPSAAKNLPPHAAAALATNQTAFRLSNTSKSIGQLVGDGHAILLENALIDTTQPLNLSIPEHLKAKGDVGSYIVQSRGAISAAFRQALAQADAQIISYIPNNSYLVKISADVADQLAKQPSVQAVIPYEPYYKIKFSLLPAAIAQDQLPDQAVLTLGLYANGANQTISQIEKMGGQIVGQSRSPFGPVVRVLPPHDWTALASLPGVQIVEPFYRRVLANDLSREVLGVSVDSVAPTNYMNLSGSNVIVMVNDSGIDTNHPDLQGRVYYDDPAFGIDTDGHGTHVAGIIAGNGNESQTVTNAPGSIITNAPVSPATTPVAAPFQFRGKAPLASLFSIGLNDDEGGIDLDLPGQSEDTSDLIQADAQTNALISNNSWVFDGDNTYDLDAASYDAATRDVQPLATGAQPMLFVFAAANDGNGDNDGGAERPGVADSIMSPATAKDVVTVGAVEELRNIVVTPPVTNADGSTGQPWQPQTDNSSQVAGFSSRGNVGVGTEGQFGRFKPDVVAPGTMVISTRSEQWDITDYFYQDPTNNDIQTYTGLIVGPGSTFLNGFPIVPDNAIGATINLLPNNNSPTPFPILPIYVGLLSSAGFDFVTTNDAVTIPPDGGAGYLDSIKSSETFFGFKYAVSNATTEPVSFDLQTDVITTNAIGDYLLAFSNLDNSIGTFNPNSTGPGPYYRYESGTSMSAADISGVLALMQDFFINHSPLTNPSPALLKAMLINGARLTGPYDYQINSMINFEGWGLANLPNSLPLTIQTNFDGTQPSSIFIQDQSVTNALATGDTQTFYFTVSTNASVLPLHVTLAWTDPPGDPAAAIKLVNNLDLIVSNMDTGDTYFGNDIPTGNFFNEAWGTNSSDAGPLTNAVNIADSINNVEQVILPPGLSQHYAITIFGKGVNVNAVSQQTNTYASNINGGTGTFAPNVVQDFALVVNCGDGEVPGAFTVTNGGVVTGFANGITNDLTVVTSTNSTLVNQFVGASSPLMGTNQVAVGNNGQWNPNGAITLGVTNQWHFYVITNTGTNSEFTNAAFITFLPSTLSTPTMGVYESSLTNATRPQADIDLYVTTDPNLLALDPTTLSNCANGTQVGASTGTSPNFVFNGVSLSRGGTEFVADTNSTPGEVYYVGVKSEDQMASEYDFLPVFTKTPFSQMTNGNEIVNGIALPTDIPDGTPLHPGVTNILMLALFPLDIADVIVTVTNTHQNFGDVIGTLYFNDSQVVLNNHDAYGAISNQFIYDDGDGSGTNGIPYSGSQRSDGPGSLQSFVGDNALGVWRLMEVDDSPGQTGTVQNVSMLIEPHRPLNKGVNVTIGPTNWFYDFIDVPAGVTNLTIFGTNVTVTINPLGPDPLNPLEMVEQLGGQPTLTNADKGPVFLTNGIAIGAGGVGLGNFISVGPSDVPPIQPGRYWIGIYNPSLTVSQDAFVIAHLDFQGEGNTINFDSTGTTAILDDAVTYSTIFCPTILPVASLNVGIMVDDPRISDLVFHLISPDGTRVLLMENRGGDDPNGAGATVLTTNVTTILTNISVLVTNVMVITNDFEGLVAGNYLSSQAVGSWAVTTNQVSIVTDPTNVFQGSNFLALANGSVSYTLPAPPVNGTYTLTFAYRGPGITAMWRGESNTVDSINANNGTGHLATTNTTIIMTNGFEGEIGNSTPGAGSYFSGWLVDFGTVDVLTNKTYDPNDFAYSGGYCIDLNGNNPGGISTNIPTVAGFSYTLQFAYAKNPTAGVPVYAGIVINGNPLAIITANQANSWANIGWQTTSFVFTATSPSTQLAFISTNSPTSSGVLFDAVSVTTNVINSTLSYTNGEVGQAFVMDGINNYISVPASPTINVGTGSGMTIDAWIQPSAITVDPSKSGGPIAEWDSSSQNGVTFWAQGGSILASAFEDTSGNQYHFQSANGLLVTNALQHVALTYDKNTGMGILYWNGTVVATDNIGNVTPQTSYALSIGQRTSSNLGQGDSYGGLVDELSIYNRGLSASEIKAIYQNGTAGKFDSGAPFSANVAKAQIGFTGQSPVTIFGSDTNWQTFTASPVTTTNAAVLTITGLEPGMLLDSIVLTNITVSASNVTMNLAVTNVVTNNFYLTFTEDTNLTYTPIKFAEPPFVPDTNTVVLSTDSFEGVIAADYTAGQSFGETDWTVVTNQISVVTDANNAYDGSNFVALASGVISNTLPTIAGNTYTLTFAYRGPGIVGWWRGEGNANDNSGNGNSGTMMNTAGFTNGEVGQAFNLAGVSACSRPATGPEVAVPDSNLWAFGTNNFTIELWANFNIVPNSCGFLQGNPYDGMFISNDEGSGGNNKWWFALDDGKLDFHINGPAVNGGSGVFLVQQPFTPVTQTWYHFAVTRNGNLYTIYTNGVAIGSQIDTNTIPNPNAPLTIGAGEGFFFNGQLDEPSIYSRALSSSEIKAIYNTGTSGKFDPTLFNTSPSQSLAEAQISVDGQTTTISGNDTTWQTETITFVATQNGTSIQIAGTEPGMLLDDFTLTQVPGDIYYLPEESLDAFNGEGAYGNWTLEIQDDRAGANLTNLLVSWELQFVFANTNPVPSILSGGVGENSQFIPANDIAWYQINVPANANFATNILSNASAPLNLWFDTNSPPTTNILFFNGLQSGTNLLSVTNPPDGDVQTPNIYDGQTYYLGVQNPNNFTVSYGIKVNFDVAGQFSSVGPTISSVSASGSATTLNWTASPSAKFQVQWTDDLTQPWNTDPQIITSNTGNFSFTDDGSQTAPLGPRRFYRLVQIAQ